MTLVVRHGAVFELQVGRIEGAVRERNLIVVRIVECFCERVRSAELKPTRPTPLDAQEQAVVFRLHTRFEILHEVWPTDDRVEDLTYGTPDDEVRAEVVQVIGAHNIVVRALAL